MTEDEWLAGTDPQAMLDCDQMDEASTRKLRLFACACCHRISRWLTDPRSREAIAVAERYADGQAGVKDLASAAGAAWEAQNGNEGAAYWASLAAHWSVDPNPAFGAREAASDVVSATVCDPDDPEVEEPAQAALLIDIFGNPWQERPTLDAAWLASNGSVVTFAHEIYARRAFERMPELAEALERAGCADAELLAHCRHEGPHVRGCWALDLLLGKT